MHHDTSEPHHLSISQKERQCQLMDERKHLDSVLEMKQKEHSIDEPQAEQRQELHQTNFKKTEHPPQIITSEMGKSKERISMKQKAIQDDATENRKESKRRIMTTLKRKDIPAILNIFEDDSNKVTIQLRTLATWRCQMKSYIFERRYQKEKVLKQRCQNPPT